ncbi:SMP-30/gluconolactonase/LRE family protein [Kordiimonas marina]|uniref:SMP-30/gluconolactonase/LRE family protein n=1 Tax=Kordiimonas marina TaxID=2872312 RepID=UPI001FF59C31|nr:SMP-30/gluconolactonase/LRE family protein [Kordiimonas marina]MCJ9428624.1 SMP-30/gluconolactonase/LRE family protein [Kordiimonas marina]
MAGNKRIKGGRVARRWVIGMAAVVLVAAGYAYDMMSDAGVFRTLHPHFSGKCTAIGGVVGVEDITIDGGGIAYLSSHDRRLWMKTGKADGAIYLYRAGSHAEPIKLPNDYKKPFHPHGLSLWKGRDGAPDRLFVINHPEESQKAMDPSTITSQVEIFDIRDDGLHHIRTMKPDENYSLNDVVAVGPDTFYASIDKGSLSAIGKKLELWGRLPKGGIAYGTINGMRFLKDGLTYANGIQASRDGKWIFVSETTGQRVRAYARDAETGALTEKASVDIPSGLDNIELADDGTLYIGAHPKLFAFTAHAKDPAKRSPSQVWKVSFDGKAFGKPKEVYLSDGNPLSGSSVAAPYKGGMLIGGVFDPLILDCDAR